MSNKAVAVGIFVVLILLGSAIYFTASHWRTAIEDYVNYQATECRLASIEHSDKHCSYCISPDRCADPCLVVRVEYLTSDRETQTSILYQKPDIGGVEAESSRVSYGIQICL